MRQRHPLLLAIALVAACTSDPDESTLAPQPTRVTVSPSLFLGEVPCHPGGGMVRYQARLLDVTESLENAFVLPSSPVVPCSVDVSFEFVQAGHRYIAEIVGFDRDDISAQNPGSPIVVDKGGASVLPRFTGTCWGREGVPLPFEDGADSSSLGGLGGGDSYGLGVLAYDRTEVFVRGCEPLVDSGEPGQTSVMFSLEGLLGSLTCGNKSGQVLGYRVLPAGTDPEDAGAGGAGGAPSSLPPDLTACSETLTLTDVAAGSTLGFTLFAYTEGTDSPSWNSECRATTLAGITVEATCKVLTPVP